MSPSWRPDKSWTGEWELPDVLLRPVSDADREALVALSCGGMGPKRLARELQGVKTVADLARRHAFEWDPSGRTSRLDRLRVRAVVPSDDEYPETLLQLDGPPPLLYVRGERLDELAPYVAMVGARACTSGAVRFTRRLASALAASGITIVSGLARGIDGAAHRGALESGRTVAVLGTGVERIYPAEHRDLAEQITLEGALVTEFPPGTEPRQWHFVARNRILAALAFATIVVEAGEKSGALITADYAADLGRDVLGCTVGPENPAGAGVRKLLTDGATLVVDVEQTVTELSSKARDGGYELEPRGSLTQLSRPDADPGAHRAIYEAIVEDATVDHIARVTGSDVGHVATVLAALELDGLVEHEGGGRWRRT